jgi:pathogenesis-related protein 1
MRKWSILSCMTTKSFYLTGMLLCLTCNGNAGGSMAQEMVSAHNFQRRRVGSPPLAWSDDLATRAQEWATTLIEQGMYAPRHDGVFGQNLFEISGGSANPVQVVSAWASEAANYNHTTNSCTARCGHYTQVVWRSTRFVGCGVARNANREVWVCDYAPHGNTIGERPY